ncbi:hypothetical protein [Microbispora sp. NPDC049125]|uniref:hypothetical protein n=1 Tax=Microbispora sp. NPDC049125 TaxID=3154929 RepID=UPI0034667A1A
MSAQEYHRILAAQMSEEALDREVRGLLDALGLGLWRVHLPDGTGGYVPGFTDLEIVGYGTTLYRELKSESGRLSPYQRAFMERLRYNGADVDVWRPRDWYSRRIHRELEAVAGPVEVQALERQRHARFKAEVRKRGSRRGFRRSA